MQPLDLDPPAPTRAALRRTARPTRTGRRDEIEARPRRPHTPPSAVRLDDILFSFIATALLLLPLVVLPFAAWLR